MFKGKFLFLISVIFLFSVSFVFADDFIYITNSTEGNRYFFSTTMSGSGLERVDNTYYTGFLDTQNGYLKNFIASSSNNGDTWSVSQITYTNVTHPNCWIMYDEDKDLVCLRNDGQYVSYYIKKYGQSNWNTTEYQFSPVDMNIISEGYEAQIFKYQNGKLVVITDDASNTDFRNKYTVDLEVGSYTFSELSLGNASASCPFGISSEYFEVGSLRDYYIKEWGGISVLRHCYVFYNSSWVINKPAYNPPYGYDDRASWSFMYRSSNGWLYHFFYYQELQYHRKNPIYNNWSDVGTLNLVAVPINNQDGKFSMAEGNNYIWGLYIDTTQNLRRFKILKNGSDLVMDEDIQLTFSNDIYSVGYIYGDKNVSQSSTVNLNQNNLMAIYVKGTGGSKELYLYRYDTNDSNPPVCSPDWFCSSYASCNIYNVSACLGVTDLNTCGQTFNGTLSTYNTVCVYNCTPDWSCNNYGVCQTGNNSQCLSVVDLNNCGFSFSGTLSYYDTWCEYICNPLWYCSQYNTVCNKTISPNKRDCLSVADRHNCGYSYAGTPKFEVSCTTNSNLNALTFQLLLQSGRWIWVLVPMLIFIFLLYIFFHWLDKESRK